MRSLLGHKHRRRWAVRYCLAYDGGGSEWVQRYRTYLGARFSMFWNKNIASWGGTAELTNDEPKPLIHIYEKPPDNGDMALCGWIRTDEMEGHRLHTSTNECPVCKELADEMGMTLLQRVPTDPDNVWRRIYGT